MPATTPTLLFYCQHSLGMGHLVRTFRLLAAARTHFRVVLLNGGRLPEGIEVPPGIELINLPPVGMDEQSQLVSLTAEFDLDQAMRLRAARLLQALRDTAPAVLCIELFPFGRKKFAGELLPLLQAARAARPRPLIICSLRDLLVGQRVDQGAHDELAVARANKYFDAVLMHADSACFRLEDSLRTDAALAVPVIYTGFVTAPSPAAGAQARGNHILASAGGGAVGTHLLETAIEAFARWRRRGAYVLHVVTGPFCPEANWQDLVARARRTPGVQLTRSLPNLIPALSTAAASISQCGYNTAMDLLRTRVPALVVPYAEGKETEQSQRARQFADLGLLRHLPAESLSVDSLLAELEYLPLFNPAPITLNLNGAHQAASAMYSLHRLTHATPLET